MADSEPPEPPVRLKLPTFLEPLPPSSPPSPHFLRGSMRIQYLACLQSLPVMAMRTTHILFPVSANLASAFLTASVLRQGSITRNLVPTSSLMPASLNNSPPRSSPARLTPGALILPAGTGMNPARFDRPSTRRRAPRSAPPCRRTAERCTTQSGSFRAWFSTRQAPFSARRLRASLLIPTCASDAPCVTRRRPTARVERGGGGGGAASSITAADCTRPASAPRRNPAGMPRYPAAAGTDGAAAILGRCVADATSGCHGSSYEYLS